VRSQRAIGSPVSNISSARFLPIARDNGTIGVEQNRPILIPGVAKRAPWASVTVAVLVVAFIKVSLIGLYFMELRHAPPLLRSIFDVWYCAVCSAVVGIYLASYRMIRKVISWPRPDGRTLEAGMT
jgi:Prokaryotic Cytochrome C oxidase subunit IV